MSNDFWEGYEPEPTRPAPMTTDRALDLALEALEEVAARTAARWALEQSYAGHLEAITAIKQARLAPMQSCYCPNCEAMGKELAALKAQLAPVQGPLSFNCSAGCGVCGVKLQDFVTHQTQAQECDEWVVVATEPQIVSTCCGSPVEVWDERKQDITASVDATPPAAQRQWVGLDDDDISALGLSIAKARALESLLKKRNT